MAKRRITRNFKQTRSERSANRSNVAYGHWQRMSGWIKNYVKDKTRYSK